MFFQTMEVNGWNELEYSDYKRNLLIFVALFWAVRRYKVSCALCSSCNKVSLRCDFSSTESQSGFSSACAEEFPKHCQRSASFLLGLLNTTRVLRFVLTQFEWCDVDYYCRRGDFLFHALKIMKTTCTLAYGKCILNYISVKWMLCV